MDDTPDSTDIRQTIESLPVFRGIDTKWLDLITPIGTFTDVERGHFIAREGQHAEFFHILISGSVAIEMSSGLSGPVTIEHLADGDIVGWSAFQHPYKWTLSALSTEDSRLLTFDAHTLRHLCHDNTDLGYFMMLRIIDVVAHRLQAARLQLLDFYS